VIEYETQRCRLFPYLAASFALHHFANSLGKDLFNFSIARISKEGSGNFFNYDHLFVSISAQTCLKSLSK
jgi:hypothetical protein